VLTLERLARHHSITQRAMLERLITTTEGKITKGLDPETPAWDAYFNVTR
jgi:hypothetical protein